ncbi:hypothetical protein IGS67_04655 [Flavimobilis sp. GY10621]|uniref:TadE-like protein n=1 Tax=Flavimobilis rhizosphaerae TaxID=2775421 RepID=A0ABR9DS57_9MICO|nr:hypothetical protein [Flavimobilis rhizosphaerae]MBD9698785.1 hypothetical protein [Flavimobilis rhizosphaerae]
MSPRVQRRPGGSSGMIVVEAVFVYPVVFMVLALVLFLGDIYYQRARVEAIVLDASIRGASQVASASLPKIAINPDTGRGSLDPSEIRNDPYRYIFSGTAGTATDEALRGTRTLVDELLNAETASFFGLAPKFDGRGATVTYESKIVRGEVSVEASYGIGVPVHKALIPSGEVRLNLDARATSTVTPMGELVRNIDMMDDLYEASGGKEIGDSVETIATAVSNFESAIAGIVK